VDGERNDPPGHRMRLDASARGFDFWELWHGWKRLPRSEHQLQRELVIGVACPKSKRPRMRGLLRIGLKPDIRSYLIFVSL
jgi:hypothetical protein